MRNHQPSADPEADTYANHQYGRYNRVPIEKLNCAVCVAPGIEGTELRAMDLWRKNFRRVFILISQEQQPWENPSR